MRKILTALGCFAAFATFAATTIDIQSTPEPGAWCSNFAKTKAYAEEHAMPMLLVYSRASCGHCQALKASLADSDFRLWQARRKIAMCYSIETVEDYQDAHAFANEPNTLTDLPLVSLYWRKDDGAILRTNFMGLNGKMLVTPGAKATLGEQLMASVDEYFAEYFAGEGSGVGFGVTGSAYDRLEAVAGVTTALYVPLTRKVADGAGTTYLRYGSAYKTVAWTAGQTSQSVLVDVPSGAKAGTDIDLVHADDAQEATLALHVVKDPGVSLANPKWLGESFAVGEWTMDLDAAKQKTASASGKAYTLVFFTGALWCPWCQGLESGVLSTSKFKNWAKKNQVNLVELDNPRRDDTPPTLLRFAAGMNKVIGKSVSGASYLTRKGISPQAGEKVIARNHELGYAGGEYCAPEAERSGYPTLVLLRKDGTVAGRFNAYAPTTTGYDTDENMQRLSDFLYLAEEGDYEAGWQSTTARTLGLAEAETATFQVSDTTEWFRLEGAFDTYVTIACAAERGVTLTVTDAAGETLATGRQRVSFRRPTAAEGLCLKATCYADASSQKYGKATTRFSASFTMTTGREKPDETVEFSSLAKQEQLALNPALYRKQAATVPIYESVGFGGRRLAGTLAVNVTAANKISAKFTGSQTLAFAGTWSEISATSGEVSAALAKSGVTLALAMDAEGGFEATLTGIGAGASAADDLTAYVGSYTVTLVDADGAAGTGYLTVKISKQGKATVSGMMPNGTAVSASATLAPNGDGTATLPVYKASAKGTLSAALAIDADAAGTWGDEGNTDTVKSVPNCLATWTVGDDTVDFDVYGGYWKSSTPLAVCELYNLSDQLAIVIAGATNDTATATKSGFKLNSKNVMTSLSFTKASGIFSGKAKVSAASGRTVTATVKGVLLPGWIDCHCSSEAVVERPYGSGMLYYKDNGVTVSMPVDLAAEGK